MRCVLAAALLLSLFAASEVVDLASDERRISYSIGHQIGSDFRRQGLDLDPGMVVQGILDALADADPLMSREDMDRALIDLKRRAEAPLAERP